MFVSLSREAVLVKLPKTCYITLLISSSERSVAVLDLCLAVSYSLREPYSRLYLPFAAQMIKESQQGLGHEGSRTGPL